MAKATKKQALGRGLSALLKNTNEDINSVQDKNAEKLVGSIVQIDLDSITENPFQPRTHFDEQALRDLANSIKELGVIQPITVRKLTGNSFQIVSGERRYRASKLANQTTIPAYIRLANDTEMLEMAIVENIQRENLDPIEIALSYQRLIDEIKLTQDEMAKRVSKSRSAVTNYLRLLKLDPIVQTGIRDGFLSMGHGRALISVEGQEEQLTIYEKIIRDKLSVRQTEALVKSTRTETLPKEEVVKHFVPKFMKTAKTDFTSFFGNKVEIKISKGNKGKIIVPFASEEDFIRIKKLLDK